MPAGLVARGSHDVVVVREIIDRMTSLASGCAERMKLSVQQVHSRPCIQITGRRGLVSRAFAIRDAKAGARPIDAALSEQNLRKLRREIPWRRINS
jgi:hypothetical protein